MKNKCWHIFQEVMFVVYVMLQAWLPATVSCVKNSFSAQSAWRSSLSRCPSHVATTSARPASPDTGTTAATASVHSASRLSRGVKIQYDHLRGLWPFQRDERQKLWWIGCGGQRWSLRHLHVEEGSLQSCSPEETHITVVKSNWTTGSARSTMLSWTCSVGRTKSVFASSASVKTTALTKLCHWK